MSVNIRLKPKQIIIIAIFITILGLVGYTALQIYPHLVALNDSYRDLDEISDEMNIMVQNKDLNIDKGKELIAAASAEIKAIQVEIRPYYGFLKKLSHLPGVGKYASQVEPVIEYISNTIFAAENLVELTSPIIDNSIYSKRSSQLIQYINSSQSIVTTADTHLQSAGEYHKLIQMDLFPDIIRSKLEKLGQLQPLLKETITILEMVPNLTGAQKPITYLIILQNSDELRPTGGFITAFGLVRLERGVVTLLKFEDSTSNNYISEVIEAPAPLKQILLAHYWLPRDANWSPSFPESARQVQKLYFYSTGIETDGVIALNQSSIEKFLLFTGPVNVAGETISADTVKGYMVEKKMDAIKAGNSENRKEFITPLVEGLIDKISQKSGKENLINFAKLIQNLTDKGDLSIFSNNPDIQTMIQKYHLDGELHPGAGDYLMLVDANLGYNKIDKIIQRNLTYIVDLTNPSTPKSNIEVTYKNSMDGIVTCRQGGDIRTETKVSYLEPSCYGNYWRILGAKGTSLLDFVVPSFNDSYFMDGFGWSHTPESNTLNNSINEVAGFMVVPTNSQRTIFLERTLPSSVLSSADNRITYRLNIQKQSGIDQLPFKIEIIIPLDTVLDVTNSDIPIYEKSGKWVWDGNISSSLTEVEVSFQNN